MTEEQKKILQLEQELERLSSQVNFFRQQVNQLKENTKTAQTVTIPSDETVVPAKNTPREFLSHQSPGKDDSPYNLENFIGLRLLHLIGIVILVIGISIGVKYAVDKELISPAARIGLAYTAGFILYFLSVRLKKKFELFSAILFSGAMASLYFTTYAAFVYYNLFPFGAAFAVMVVITIFTAYTAIRYDKQEIAILGMTGAYGIPFLISANTDRVDLFFAYIILINCGIVFLSYKKRWKGMLRLAMLVSWALFLGWAFTGYTYTTKLQAIIVITIFYLMFALAAVGPAVNKRRLLDIAELHLFLLNNILVVASVLVIFTAAVFDNRSVAITGITGLFFSVQALLVKYRLPREEIAFKYLFAFAVLSFTFYTGMKWDGVKVTMIWLAISIGLFVAGAVSKMGWLRLFSMLLTGVTLGKLVLIDRNSFTTEQKIISYISIGVLLLLFSFFYQKFRQRLIKENED